MPEIDTKVHVSAFGNEHRRCPICTRKLPLSSFRGDIEDWNDERLAIPCCTCLKVLDTVERLRIDLSNRFKKTAVISEDYEYITTEVKGKTRWNFYRGYYTKQEFESFLFDMLKFKYCMLMPGTTIKTVIKKLKIWGIIDG